MNNVIEDETASYMLASLTLMKCQPQSILILGNINPLQGPLKNLYPQADIIAHGLSGRMPFPDHRIDFIICNLVLAWEMQNITHILAEWRRTLREEGLLMFSCFGHDTLCELKNQIHFLPQFEDMHNIGDALVLAGFADPVLETEHLSVRYREKELLVSELKQTRMITEESALILPDSAMPYTLTYEIIYAHAWQPIGPAFKQDGRGEVKIPLGHLRKQLRGT